MNKSQTLTAAHIQDEFGERIVARLSEGTRQLPHDLSERLRMARLQALARRKVVNVRARTASAIFGQGNTATATFGSGKLGFWGRLASAVPLVALVGGLVLIHSVQSDNRVSELAEVDSALLSDDLPPAAYTDSGFVEFLKNSASEQH
ncbi:DUF3619 family protein [Xylophilus sp. GW821-FHT01B05]